MKNKQVIIIGGGAGGFFAAINLKEKNPNYNVSILEQTNTVLKKVKISGGGRCNVTHSCFEPEELTKNYPRGEKELLGAFYQFQPQDMIEWLRKRGVKTKTESDGRMFPVSDDSQTIIDCFLKETRKLNITINKGFAVEKLIPPTEENHQKWQIQIKNKPNLEADALVFATGSQPKSWKMLTDLGHSISNPVPSLFTMDVKNDNRLKGLAGVSVNNGTVWAKDTQLSTENGAVLVTHWGFSAPAVLRLSAWGARELAEKNYKFEMGVNWIEDTPKNALKILKAHREEWRKKQIGTLCPFEIPNRLWRKLIEAAQIDSKTNWASLSNKELESLANELTKGIFHVNGKSTHKDEFVTCGGIDLTEVDFKTMESKILPNLYFTGEVLNIDAITGGFNFQAAWTTAWIAAQNI
ncbi:flavoprotein, HI0933 family [Bernardetia litoralis DSM 6794]|uniref:Flavoprotein, HI0933 family n=1 Tax=Bernardetia litoralis (strain ATCC 23117 / DSM 6794 / NBRC 15988 / NCIMB 1366 / Fx l1 / Sio-4) TaxID=880071 RepID=I4AMI5_BERLS|nr:NAD(P)/FAD-dependent oxidoreductase [Bernardetia litoralis]AFM05170.1 flavoprotein, HI0933 family [Bernardetia litoralis DSM 6794]